ncbi:hypothetical protein JXM83_01275 [Candidatus Woesearchaeota archaeon]|nr:hypothetical protein [Candidatus Woesearchaeota archaeon]
MKVHVSKLIGFCPGVRFAVEGLDYLVLQNPKKRFFLFGDLVHNNIIMNDFVFRGVNVITDKSKAIGYDYLIIPSHGISSLVKNTLSPTVVDYTCQNVLNLRLAVENSIKQGYSVVIFGDSNHGEVLSIALDFPEIIITRNPLDVSFTEKFVVVSQTTMSRDDFNSFVSNLGFDKEIIVKDTICPFTEQRLFFAKMLLKSVDCAVVVGSKHSSNTLRMLELCRSMVPSFIVEDSSELNSDAFIGFNQVGVFSGTSTSDKQIEEVIDVLKTF